MSVHTPRTDFPGGPLQLQEMRGPAAVSGSLKRFLQLVWTIGSTEFRLAYFGSVLGYFWTLLRPMLMFGVYLVVFTLIFEIKGDAVPAHFAEVLLFNIMVYQFFVEATSGAVQSVVTREGLVRKMQFPRLVIPMSVVLTALLNLIPNLIVAFVLSIAMGLPPRIEWIFVPLAILPVIIFTAGLSMWLAAAFVKYRDVQPIWALVTQVLFYATPILYSMGTIKFEWLKTILEYNPLTGLFEGLHALLVDKNEYNAKVVGVINAWGGWDKAWIPIGFLVFSFVGGLWYFNKQAQNAAEIL